MRETFCRIINCILSDRQNNYIVASVHECGMMVALLPKKKLTSC